MNKQYFDKTGKEILAGDIITGLGLDDESVFVAGVWERDGQLFSLGIRLELLQPSQNCTIIGHAGENRDWLKDQILIDVRDFLKTS